MPLENLSDYDQACKHELQGEFSQALALYHKCLAHQEYDKGDILFKCGWCVEQDKSVGTSTNAEALAYYQQAAEMTRVPATKLNSLFRAGWLLMQDKQWLEAGQCLKRALEYAEQSDLKTSMYAHTLYWYAVCLETQGHFLEAIQWYRLAQEIAPELKLESCVREICCLDQVGQYQEALNVCLNFTSMSSESCDERRYHELFSVVQHKKNILKECLSQLFSPSYKRKVQD